MLFDGIEQVRRAAIVEEENALAEAPQRRGAELVSGRGALGDAVGEIAAHVMDEQIGEEVRGGLIHTRSDGGRRGGQRRCVAQGAPDASEGLATSADGGRTAGGGGR